MKEQILKTSDQELIWNPTHMHTWFLLSLELLLYGIITKQRSFQVGDSEAALLVSFYLSAAASSLCLSFSTSQDCRAV